MFASRKEAEAVIGRLESNRNRPTKPKDTRRHLKYRIYFTLAKQALESRSFVLGCYHWVHYKRT